MGIATIRAHSAKTTALPIRQAKPPRHLREDVSIQYVPASVREKRERRAMRMIGATTAALILIAATVIGSRAYAAAFEVAASPARFELTGKSGQRVGQSVDIYNVGGVATEVSVRTIDWTFSEDGKIGFHDELLPNSCREWVTLERKTVKIGARSKKAFRFQVEVPAGAAKRECRFMLAVEGIEPAHKALIESGGASLSLPVSGRLALAVYVAVNGAQPTLEYKDVKMIDRDGKRMPVVMVTNTGDAHGRLDGSLEAKDAKGIEFELVPDGTPILPGQTRLIGLAPKTEGKTAPIVPAYPMAAKGALDWDRGSFKIAAEFKQ
jgi:fimbrial chaperone protein